VYLLTKYITSGPHRQGFSIWKLLWYTTIRWVQRSSQFVTGCERLLLEDLLKVAIVHDWLNQIGGAEEVLSALKEMFPNAPVYTSIYWPEKMPEAYRSWDIRCSFMDKLPLVKRDHRLFLPLYPIAFEAFDLSDYDLVLSNKSGFTAGDTSHLLLSNTDKISLALQRLCEEGRSREPDSYSTDAFRPLLAIVGPVGC